MFFIICCKDFKSIDQYSGILSAFLLERSLQISFISNQTDSKSYFWLCLDFLLFFDKIRKALFEFYVKLAKSFYVDTFFSYIKNPSKPLVTTPLQSDRTH